MSERRPTWTETGSCYRAARSGGRSCWTAWRTRGSAPCLMVGAETRTSSSQLAARCKPWRTCRGLANGKLNVRSAQWPPLKLGTAMATCAVGATVGYCLPRTSRHQATRTAGRAVRGTSVVPVPAVPATGRDWGRAEQGSRWACGNGIRLGLVWALFWPGGPWWSRRAAPPPPPAGRCRCRPLAAAPHAGPVLDPARATPTSSVRCRC